MMRARIGWLTSASCGIGALVLSACPPENVCTEEAVAGANVTVEDDTGARVCDAVVQVVNEDGEQEQLEAQPPDGDCVYVGLYEKPGVYDLDVFRDGYSRVLLGDALRIEMTEDGCHVVPEEKTVTLEPE